LDGLEDLGMGCIGFSPLAQGLLTKKYLNGVPEGARATKSPSFRSEWLTEYNIGIIRHLTDLAEQRGQTLAQMAIAWALRDPRMTTALIGTRTVEQLADSLKSLNNLSFTPEELKQIDELKL